MAHPKHHLRKAIIAALPDIAQQLPSDCELFVVAVQPGQSDFDLVLPSPEANLNNALDALRRNGLSIDGDNAYKRDLCDSIVGALAFGAQNRNPPPPGHWGQKFWEIGREERALTQEMLAALKAARDLWGDYLPPENSNAMKAMRLVDAAIAKATL